MAVDPKTCSLPPFLASAVPSRASPEQAASAMQLIVQQLELYLRRAFATICEDLRTSGGSGVTRFLQLLDVPNSYAGANGNFVRVNAAETALEFFNLTATLVTSFLQLSDTPSTYAAQALKALRVNAGENAVEFFTQALLLLADFPNAYTGAALQALRVNAGENAVEFFTQLFTLLGDTPTSYAGQAGNLVVVNNSETGLEFSNVVPPPPAPNDVRNFTVNQTTQTAWFIAVATPFMGAVGISAFTIEVGTGSFVLPATGNTLLSRAHARYVSAGGANSNAAIRNSGNLTVRLGSAAGEGGLRLCIRIGVDTAVANTRFFAGLSATIGFGNVTLLSRVNVLGFGWDAAVDANVQILHNDGAGNIQKVDLGGSFPANDGVTLYDLQIVASPNQGGFVYRVQNMNTGAVASNTVTTAELPAGTQGLTPYIWIHNGGTATAVAICPSFLILNNYD